MAGLVPAIHVFARDEGVDARHKAGHDGGEAGALDGSFVTMQKIDRQAAFTGTKEVAEPLRFDSARLETYLEREVSGFSGPLTVRQFKGGQSNPTYLLETPARKYVMRRKPPGKLLPSAHAVDREFRVIKALDAQNFPVAGPVLYCADDSVAGTAFYVMEFVPGRVFWNPEMPGSNPGERTAVYDAMNAALARLHTFDPAAIGLSDFGRGENYVARQVDRWSKQYRASETQTIDDMERLIEWLPAHIPPAGPPRLVHGDYRLDNVILHAAGPRVLAVLDWELSTLGDPLADFTYHLMQWHMPPDELGAGTGSLVDFDLAALGIPSLAAYVDLYRARTGLDPRPHLATYLAYNFFRIAAILQGITGRVRDGTATSEHAPAKAQMVRPLAEVAWRFAREAGGDEV
jgi:aminoglycoside phosphotransferase (APT) family kinase protein